MTDWMKEAFKHMLWLPKSAWTRIQNEDGRRRYMTIIVVVEIIALMCGCVQQFNSTLPTTTSTTSTSTTTTTSTSTTTTTSTTSTLSAYNLMRYRGLIPITITTSTVTTTTFKLKHQGNYSANLGTTSTTTITLPGFMHIYDYMQTCANDSDCALVNEGCCPCFAGGDVVPISRNYSVWWNRQLDIQCPFMINCGGEVCIHCNKPCKYYYAYCDNGVCARTMEQKNTLR
jgi:hypothetical protein